MNLQTIETQVSLWINRLVKYGAPILALTFGILHAFGINVDTGEVHQLWTWVGPAIIAAGAHLVKNPEEYEKLVEEATNDFPFDVDTGERLIKTIKDVTSGDFNFGEIRDVIDRLTKIIDGDVPSS